MTLAEFENGLARIKHSPVVHWIDPNPLRFDVECHSHRSQRPADGSDLRPAMDAQQPTCKVCLTLGPATCYGCGETLSLRVSQLMRLDNPTDLEVLELNAANAKHNACFT